MNKVLYSKSGKGQRSKEEFNIAEGYSEGLGLEIGCGNNRFRKDILTIDIAETSDVDLVWNAEKLPFTDRTFDFIFSSYCLKDFENPLKILKEWLRCIKIMGNLILVLPDMENNNDWKEIAKFQCTQKYIFDLIKKLPVELVDMKIYNNSISFGVVLKRLPQERDKYLMVYTPFGQALRISETENKIKVIYEDKTEKILNKSEIKIAGEARRIPDILYTL